MSVEMESAPVEPSRTTDLRSSNTVPPKSVVSRPLLIGLLILLTPLAVYLWLRPSLQEKQLQKATLPELQAMAKRQDDPRILYYLGLRQKEKGDLAAAYATWKQASTLTVSDEKLWLALADAGLNVEGEQAAFNTLATFVKNNPRSAAGHLAFARMYLERRSYRRAREEARLATDNDPKLVEAWRIAGQAALAMELPGDAEPDLRRAVALAPNDWESQTALGDALAARNLFAESVPVYQEAARLAPTEPVPPLSLGRALLKSAPANATPEQLKPAEESLRRSLSLRDDISVAYLLLGQCLARQNRYSDAMTALKRARDLAPAEPDAYFELSRVAAQSGDRAASEAYRAQHSEVQKRRNAFGDRKRTFIAQIENALRDQDQAKADNLRRELAPFLADGGEILEALQQYNLLLARHSNDTALLQNAAALQAKLQEAAFARMSPAQLAALGNNLMRQKRYPEAADAYGTALARDAKNADAAEGLGLILQMAGRGEEATFYLLAATRLDARRTRSEFALGMRYKEIGFLAEAQRRFQKVVALEPQNAAAWHELGLVQRDRDGGEVEAEASFQRAVDLELKNAAYLVDLADILDTNGKTGLAEETFRRALALNANSGEVNASLGAFLVNHPSGESRKEAERLLNRALTIDPKDDFARYYLGKLALDKGDAATAVSLMETVLKNDPSAGSREIWYSLSRAYTRRNGVGDKEKAAKAMAISHKLETEGIAYIQAREQVALHPNDPNRHVDYARVLAERRENARAITEYERALKLDRAHKIARQELTGLKVRLEAAGEMPSMSVYRALTAPSVRQQETSGR